MTRRTRVPRPSPASGPRRSSSGGGRGSSGILRLQKAVGNRAVAGYLSALSVQRVKEGDGPSNAVAIIQQQLNAVGAKPRVAITGRFDAATTSATKAFQKVLIGEKIKGVTEDGIVDGATHKQLKKRAPSVKRSGQDTVVVGPGNTQVPLNPKDGVHKQLKRGHRGIAVKELQERLNNSKSAGKKLVVDGIFGWRTDRGVKTFQKGIKMAETGVADAPFWSKLATAGFATQGHHEFDWREEVEGVKNVGLRASYDWRLTKTALTITAGIRFRQKHKGVNGQINQWIQDIHDLWSTFRAVNHSDPKKPAVNLEFKAKRGGSDHVVNVFKFDPSLPKAQRPLSRSDSSNWYTVDTRRSLAPHEFGHLIGLADEYNRTEEHYVDVTGEEPNIGNVEAKKSVADAKKIAKNIKAQIPLNDLKGKAAITKWNDPRWGANLAAVVTGALGSSQGGFSRLVAQQYQANNGTKVYNDIQKAFNDRKVPGFQANLSNSVTPFLYSNRSLMGTMQTTPAKGDGGKSAPDHEHPIEPRHVQPFINILSKEWALQTGKADVWKPERR